jgi:hypothetical protein
MSASPSAIVRGSIPIHPAGMVERATRSEALLAAGDSRQPSFSVCLDRSAPSWFSLATFDQELVWGNEEGVLLQHPSDNHEMNPQHIHHPDINSQALSDDQAGESKMLFRFHEVVFARCFEIPNGCGL